MKKPTIVAVITTGPGLSMPAATWTRNSRLIQPSGLLHEAFLEEGKGNETTAECNAAGLQEKHEQRAQCGYSRRLCDADAQWGAGEKRIRCAVARKPRAAIEDAENTGPDEPHRRLGFQPDRYEAATGRNHPLQPVIHAEFGEAVTGMDDQRDHRRLTP